MTHVSVANRLGVASGIWATLAVITVLVSSIIIDFQGRSPRNHAGSPPAGVTQLTANSYLVDYRVALDRVCSDSYGVEESVPVRSLPGKLFVECGYDQTWNDPRPGSPNFGNAFLRVVTNAWALLAAGVVWMVLTVALVAPTLMQQRRDRRRRRVDAEEKRLALAEAYASDKITDVQYERGLDRLRADLGKRGS
jgi:hypothetical protein